MFSQWCLLNEPSIFLGALEIAWVTSSITEWYNWRQIKGSSVLFFGTTSSSRGPLVQGWRANHKRNRRYLSLRGREREKWRKNSPEHTSSSTGTWRAGRILQVQCKKQYSKQRVFWDTDDIWMWLKLYVPCKGDHVSCYYSLLTSNAITRY